MSEAGNDVLAGGATKRLAATFPTGDFALFVLVAAAVGVALAGGPWMTNDGPVHVVFAYLLDHLRDPGHPLQQMVYRLDMRLQPNLLGDLMMSGLMRLTTPVAAEAVIQYLSLLGPMLASLLAFRQISRASSWLCIFIFILSLNQLFFFGLYNFALSTAVFFLAVAAHYRLMAAASMRSAGFLGGALGLAVLCHAGGFIAAWSGIAAMVLAQIATRRARGGSLRAAIGSSCWSLIGLAVPLPLFVYALMQNAGGKVLYGIGVVERLREFVSLYLLSLHSGLEPARFALMLIILGATATTLRWAWRARATISPDQRERLIATSSAALLATVVMLIVPDTMGGGWTHFRRFELFVLFWALLIIAEFPMTRYQRRAAVFIGIAFATIFFGATLVRSHIARPRLAPLDAVDRLVGAHCTMLPIVITGVPDDLNHKAFTYKPFEQAANRLELSGDRVVLYNFLARLAVYPVHYSASYEPQENLFHWPRQRENDSPLLPPDVAGYEQRAGLHVDYVLVWGAPAAASPAVRRAIDALVAARTPLYKSTIGPMALFRRPGPTGSICRNGS